MADLGVALVLACRNDADSLAACLDACLAQTHPAQEIVVVDAGSSDGSRRIIEDYSQRHPGALRAEFLPTATDGGEALWRAVLATTAPYVALVDPRDLAVPHRLAAGLELLAANPSLAAVCSTVQAVDRAGRPTPWLDDAPANQPGDNPRWHLLGGHPLDWCTVLARGERLRAVATGSPLGHAADLDRWLRLLDSGEIHREARPWVHRRLAGPPVPPAPLLAECYETAAAIIDALGRWPLEKTFRLASPAGSPERLREAAQCHARLAAHALDLDARLFGHAHLGTPEAYRQIRAALRLDPDNALARQLLAEVWRRLGDGARAGGGASMSLADWQKAPPPPVALAPAPAPSPAATAFRVWQAKTAFQDIDGEHLARRQHAWTRRPRFVVIVDATAPDLAVSLQSLDQQFYGHWVTALVAGGPGADQKRHFAFPAGVAADALLAALPGGGPDDWALLLPPGTRLEAHALFALADHLDRHPQCQALYADDAGPDGLPRFKPDFDPVLLAGRDYLGAVLVSAPLFAALAPGAPPSPGLAHALVRQLAATAGEPFIGHVSDVLFTLNPAAATPAEAVQRACTAALLGLPPERLAQVDGPLPGSHWVLPQPAHWPPVTVIALGVSPQALGAATDYPALRCAGPLAPAPLALAEALQSCPDDLVLILSAAVRPATPEYLQALVATLEGWQAGMVGPAIVDAQGRLEGAGLVLGQGGAVGPALPGTPFGQGGDALGRAALPHRVGALDASALLLSRAALAAAGGLDTGYGSLAACLADAALRLAAAGKPPLWTPLARLDRLAPAPAVQEDPAPFVQRWLPRLAADPAWNRNLSLADGNALAETDLVARWRPGRAEALRILALPLAPSGQAEYRVSAPLRALDRLGLAQTASACEPWPGRERAPTPAELARLAPDVLYAQATIDDVRLRGYLAAARFNPDIYRVFSLDDRVSDIPAYNAAHRSLPREKVAERMALALAHSDRLIVSTAPLAELYGPQVAETRIVPNRLEKPLWLDAATRPRPPRKSRRPRVGWAGALQHGGDLALVAPLVEALADEVDWVFFGMIPIGCERFVAEFHPPVKPYAAYPAKLASLDLDLALAPLEINLFNEAKSNLRLLEYGIFGWPVIASDILPYRSDDAPVCRVPNRPHAWIAAVRERLAEREALQAEGRRLEAWVRSRYLLEDHAQEWLEALSPGPRRPRPAVPAVAAPAAPPASPTPAADMQGGWPPGPGDGKPRILAASQTTLLHDYRAASPLRALRQNGLAHTLLFGRPHSDQVSCLTGAEIAALAPDATYWNFIVDDLRLAEGIARCARDFPDLPRVYGLDDRIGDLPPQHPYATRFSGAQLDRRLREALALCRRLVVSTPPLAELYGPLAESVRVVPNRLERALWQGVAPPAREAAPPRRLRVGWAGAQQHAADLALLRPVIAATADTFDWVFFGMAPAGCEAWVREIHPAVPFPDYPARLAALDLDIALAPLEINLFNEAKSNLRLLDYGWLGWPVICTDILPYRENAPPVIRVANTPEAWTTALHALAADPDTRHRLGQELAAWVRRHYVLEDHLEEWREALVPGWGG